ncbi:MAG: murein biosynthesis integral membrane protein MurJ [Angustibacter sp.]
MSDQALLRSSGIMAAGTAVSRVLGLVRTMMMVGLLGVSGALAADTFATANTVPNNIYNLIAGGLLNAILVPQIVRASRDSDGGQAFLDRLLTLALAGMAIVTALVTVCAPLVPVVFGPGAKWDADTRALAVAFAFWCLPQVFFYGLYTVLGQVLNAQGRFGAYMWAPVVNNIIGIAGLVVMFQWIGGYERGTRVHPPSSWTSGQVAVLAGSATLGVVAQALILLWPLWRAGFRYRPRLGLRGVGLGSAGRVAGWTFAAALLGQLGYVVTARTVNGASADGGPGQNAYGPGFLLFILPHSLVTVSLVTALFTRMSRAAQDDDRAAVRQDLSVGLRLTAVASVLALAVVAALASDLTGVLFWNNEPAETEAIASVVVAMMLGLAPFSAQYLFQRVYYAYGDARTPFLVQIPVVGTIALTSYLAGARLAPGDVVVGVGAGMSVAYVLGAVLSALGLARRLGGIDGARVRRTYLRLLIAGVPAVVAGRLTSRFVHSVTDPGRAANLIGLVVGGVVVTLLYLACCRLMRVSEVEELAAPLLSRLPVGIRSGGRGTGPRHRAGPPSRPPRGIQYSGLADTSTWSGFEDPTPSAVLQVVSPAPGRSGLVDLGLVDPVDHHADPDVDPAADSRIGSRVQPARRSTSRHRRPPSG